MVDVARARRLAERIHEVVAATLEREVKDPRLGLVTITDVRLTPDLREATVFYTVYGEESDRTASAAALESAKGLLRTAVGRQLGVKHTPSLAFVLDALPESASHIDDLLRRAAEADAHVHRVAEQAAPAGEPNPYRAPREDDADEAVSG